MKWSWKLGSVAGIGIYVHVTFLLLLVWLGLNHWSASHSLMAVVEGVGFILALFCCVVLHELGHALAAQRYGIQTRQIMLLPIGGIASLEKIPSDPWQELVVAIAGPLVNVVIAMCLLIGLTLANHLQSVESISVTGGDFLTRLMVVNVALVLFNLLPAFPMDGGRILRAILAMQFDYTKATQVAASVGQAIALGLGVVGLLVNPILAFIAVFVWVGASYEAAMVSFEAEIVNLPVRAVMQSDYQILSSQNSLHQAVEMTLRGEQKDFPILDEQQTVVGVLTQPDMLKALTTSGPETLIADVMDEDFEVAAPHDLLSTLMSRLGEHSCQTIPVLEAGHLVGIVTMENIHEFMKIRLAIRSSLQTSNSGTGELPR